MKPTEILMEEHRVIEQVLDSLELMAERCGSEGTLEAQPAKDAVAFFRAFADHCHHGKEEVHLFPLLEARGFPRQGGPTGQMLLEHEHGRSLVRGMDGVIERASTGDVAAQRSFVEFAQEYIELLRQHIQKEDHCLFSMANQALSEEDQRALTSSFEKVEHEEMGQGTHEAYLKIADDLAEKYGVKRAVVRAVKCCGH